MASPNKKWSIYITWLRQTEETVWLEYATPVCLRNDWHYSWSLIGCVLILHNPNTRASRNHRHTTSSWGDECSKYDVLRQVHCTHSSPVHCLHQNIGQRSHQIRLDLRCSCMAMAILMLTCNTFPYMLTQRHKHRTICSIWGNLIRVFTDSFELPRLYTVYILYAADTRSNTETVSHTCIVIR